MSRSSARFPEQHSADDRAESIVTAVVLSVIAMIVCLIGSMGCSHVASTVEAVTDVDESASSKARSASTPNQSVKFLNASYDPTREFYQAFNTAFSKYWKNETGQSVTIDQAHGGSGKQARAVIDGSGADVVTLALAHDIDQIAAKSGLLPTNWQSRLPLNSSPYTSTIVFLVRAGNPKNIRDWDDLVQGDVEVITANPKTGGGARWNYLAAWGYALHRELGSFERLKSPNDLEKVAEAKNAAEAYVRELYRRVPVLDSAARGSTNTFIQRGIGDVLLTWESEAFLAVNESGKGKVEIVVPTLSILAEPPVAVVDKNAEAHGVQEVATAYLEYLYSIPGQTLAAEYFYRPRIVDGISRELLDRFQDVELFSLEEVFTNWAEAQRTHFDDGEFSTESINRMDDETDKTSSQNANGHESSEESTITCN